MDKYVERLIKCGYSVSEARKICYDFLKDFCLFDLINFILFMENEHVDKV